MAHDGPSPLTGTKPPTVSQVRSGSPGMAVDHRGVGHDLAYVGVDPHFSYLVIESSNIDWSVSVEEPALVGGGGAK